MSARSKLLEAQIANIVELLDGIEAVACLLSENEHGVIASNALSLIEREASTARDMVLAIDVLDAGATPEPKTADVTPIRKRSPAELEPEHAQ
jgi:hypothetical protein